MTICAYHEGSCGGDIIWWKGKCYSLHFGLGHWSRINKGKPKNEFAADTTDEEQASLAKAIAAAKELR